MTDESHVESKTPLAQQAARASLLAPFIAIGMNILMIPMTINSPDQRRVMGVVVLGLILVGLICAIIGLCGVKKRFSVSKRRGIDLIIISMFGLLLNGAFIAIIIGGVVQFHQIATAKITVVPPVAFKELPKETIKEPDITHFYILGNPNDEEPDIFLVIEDLGGVIAKGNKAKDAFASRPHITVYEDTWKGHTIEVVRIPENLEGVPFVTFNIPLPTLPKAIQVKLAGPQEKEDEIKKYIKEVLKGIDGPTNW